MRILPERVHQMGHHPAVVWEFPVSALPEREVFRHVAEVAEPEAFGFERFYTFVDPRLVDTEQLVGRDAEIQRYRREEGYVRESLARFP